MKRILVMILFFLLVMGICGCVSLQSGSDKKSKEDNNDNEYRYPIQFEENANGSDEFRYPICFVPND